MIISHEKILDALKKPTSKEERLFIIEKAKNYKGLSPEEAASLFFVEKEEEDALFLAAKQIKARIYGSRVVLFAPLYTGDVCDNDCLYCSFRVSNTKIKRKNLSLDEIIEEAKVLAQMGHKRVLMVCGEGSDTNAKHIYSAVTSVYEKTNIKRINVNIAPLDIDGFEIIKKAGIGTYQLFQETYNQDMYKKMHLSGPKSDYNYRLTALDRAFKAKIDDLGMGILLGLYDYKYDVIASLFHGQYLENIYGVGPHTISIPRLRPAKGSSLSKSPYIVTDDDLKKIVAIYRLAMPYTGIILSTRESPALRDALLDVGVSQVSAASKTNPGGYTDNKDGNTQFETYDKRSLIQFIESITDREYLPSFCTACYRNNRTGEAFMELAKDGSIHEFCTPNSILTFKEYLCEQNIKNEKFDQLIKSQIEVINNEPLKNELKKRLASIEEGKRDLFF